MPAAPFWCREREGGAATAAAAAAPIPSRGGEERAQYQATTLALLGIEYRPAPCCSVCSRPPRLSLDFGVERDGNTPAFASAERAIRAARRANLRWIDGKIQCAIWSGVRPPFLAASRALVCLSSAPWTFARSPAPATQQKCILPRAPPAHCRHNRGFYRCNTSIRRLSDSFLLRTHSHGSQKQRLVAHRGQVRTLSLSPLLWVRRPSTGSPSRCLRTLP